MTRRFLIYVPKLNVRSNGVSLLYEFGLMLRELNEAVALVCYAGKAYSETDPEASRYLGIPCFQWKVDFGPDRVQPEDVAVYSETVSGNPLAAPRTVRYLMNIPGVLGLTAVNYRPSDFLVSYSLGVDALLPQLFILKEHEVSPGTANKKDQVTVHFGKVNLRSLTRRVLEVRGLISRFPRVNVITRNHPRDRRELVSTLAESKLLVSFDPLSNIHYEATLLGTPVLIADDTISKTSKGFNIPLHGIYHSGSTDFSDFSHATVAEIHRKQISQGNRDSVTSFLHSMEEHFERWETEPSYRRDREIELVAARRRWASIHESAGRYELSNIDELDYVPRLALFLLCPRVVMDPSFWWSREHKNSRFLGRLTTLFKRILTAENLRFSLREHFSTTQGYRRLKRAFHAVKRATVGSSRE